MNDIFIKRVLTLDEVIILTGFKRSYIYKLIHLGLMPGVSKPLGQRLFFDREVIENWLLSKPLPTKLELEIKAETYCKTGKL